ncbi:MAG: hypothetical protein V9E89_16645 [Ilumatobacteraceae bacterium]
MTDEQDSPGQQASSGLAGERAKRLGKIAALRSTGANPYPYRFDRTHTLAEVRAQYGELAPGTETEAAVARGRADAAQA